MGIRPLHTDDCTTSHGNNCNVCRQELSKRIIHPSLILVLSVLPSAPRIKATPFLFFTRVLQPPSPPPSTTTGVARPFRARGANERTAVDWNSTSACLLCSSGSGCLASSPYYGNGGGKNTTVQFETLTSVDVPSSAPLLVVSQ